MRQRLWALTLAVLLLTGMTSVNAIAQEKENRNTVSAPAGYVTLEQFSRFQTSQNGKIRELKERIKALEAALKNGTVTPPAAPQPIGIGPYMAVSEGAGRFTWWLEQSAGKGATLLRIIPLSSSWSDGLRHPFLRTESGKFDLTKLDVTWRDELQAGLTKARELGITVVIDVFDEVGLEASDRQNRHPFNGQNNVHSDAPVPGVAYSTTDPGRARSFKQQVEHALKRDWEGPAQTFHLVLREYVFRLVEALKGYEDVVILIVGNETESRSVESVVYDWFDQAGWTGRRGLNGTYLYGDETGYQLLADSVKRDLFSRSTDLRIHHLKPDTVEPLISNLDAILSAYPQLHVIGDSDGAGSGYVRGESGRPTYEQEAQAKESFLARLGARARGWVAKILGEPDGLSMLAALAQ